MRESETGPFEILLCFRVPARERNRGVTSGPEHGEPDHMLDPDRLGRVDENLRHLHHVGNQGSEQKQMVGAVQRRADGSGPLEVDRHGIDSGPWGKLARIARRRADGGPGLGELIHDS